LATFILTLIISLLFWAVFFWLILFISNEVRGELYITFIFTSPILTPWTLACLMSLALWPFHEVRNVEPSS
jgi:hypothetical protein